MTVKCSICGKKEQAEPPTQQPRPGNEMVWLCDECEKSSIESLTALGLGYKIVGNVFVWEGDENLTY